MIRRLRHLLVEAGQCENCGGDPGDHSIEGLCETDMPVTGSAYRGKRQYVFLDLDSPECKSLVDGVLVRRGA